MPWTFVSPSISVYLTVQVFFQPEMFSPDFNTPLAQVVDDCILSAPTDCRRQLYNNIVLSGGSTMFKVHWWLWLLLSAL